MNRYLLDANACIAMMKKNAGVLNRILEVGMDSLLLCAPVKAELWFGACKSQRIAENQARLHLFFNDLPSLPFDDDAAEHFGDIRADLARQGKPIGPYDLQIAAIARVRGLVVVTHNTREFTRIPGLMVEDWQINP
ncbi:MAG: type II toxin-antitoxin system VapC family toxin [Candidatus Contendobacter sp.]|nr:type II toxin-antitoxin system VapC family toxin [Candidatus Contendobacter sp.]MDG4557587.1 type II toxin-antitoxin system VapC family toxin [Candidatus Contendobacter sp.]